MKKLYIHYITMKNNKKDKDWQMDHDLQEKKQKPKRLIKTERFTWNEVNLEDKLKKWSWTKKDKGRRSYFDPEDQR